MRRIKCKRCGTVFEVGPGDKRKTGRCFTCGATFALPSPIRPFAIAGAVVFLALLAVAFAVSR
ncbi:MAG: hypothetical protein KF886_12305 [Candidatus Hydrogenedentes bacterium]|nr:hypothetical protein [Candidatus Hydrogenedentota bacterium]